MNTATNQTPKPIRLDVDKMLDQWSFGSLEELPMTYRIQFARAVRSIVRFFDKEYPDYENLSDDDYRYTIVESSSEEADRRFGTVYGEKKDDQVSDWRSAVESAVEMALGRKVVG